ncbi:MAG: tetratricopeptide repeat protein [Deltaproteobacteria bacterium]|nr:tetratricopeptide repeat protein [Deltaproteobacteria bacterium]
MTDLQAHLKALAEQPGDPAALSAVEGELRREGRWEELLRIYEDNAQRGDKGLATQMWRKAASLCLGELASAQRAEAYLARGVEATPTDIESLRMLRTLYLARGDYERAVDTYERELSRATDAKGRAQGFVEAAEICREQLKRDDRALSLLRQAQRADKSNPAIYRATAAIYLQQGRLDQALTALLTEIENGGVTDDIVSRLTYLASRMLERPKLHEAARNAIEQLLKARPKDSQARAVLAELDAYKSAWSSKVVELSQQAAASGRSDPNQTAEYWLTVAEIQQVYGGQPDAALSSLDKAVALRPGHPGALRLMEEVYGAQDRYEDLALKLEMMAAYAREPAVAVELYLKAAMHHAVRLDNPEAAAGVHRRVLELDPGNKMSSNALAEYHRERKEWEAALQVLHAWAERATQAADKVAAHYACCRILEEELGDVVRARPDYEAILGLDPTNQAAARALEAVYRKAGDHQALARTLKAKLAGAGGDDRTTILNELGDLFAGPLKQPADALEALGELYVATPTPKLRERLEELAAQANAFAVLVKILEDGLEHIVVDADRIQALHSLAALYEGAREAPLDALRIHRRILALAPADAAAKEAFERLLQAAAATGDKISFYREQADAAGSGTERVTILKKLAVELVDTAKDYVRAIDVYREILKLQPEDAAALEALVGLYRRDNRWAEVADILLHKRERVADAAGRLPIELELAQIMEQRLGEVDRAVDWYVTVLKSSPGNELAIAGLERLLARAKRVSLIAETLQPFYLGRERFDRAVAMLEIRIRGSNDNAQRVEHLRHAATLYESRLNQAPQALGALLRAFQLDPADSGLQVDLERLAVKLADFAGLTRAYRAAAVTVEGEARSRLLNRAAGMAEKGGDLAGATLDCLRVVGFGDEGEKAALATLSRLVKAGLERKTVLEAAASVATGLEGQELSNYWRKLARYYEHDMNSTVDAIQAWKTVLAQHQNDPEAVAELDRLYATAGEPAELVAHLRAKLAAAVDDTSRAALGGQIAEVLDTKLNDTAAAILELTHVAELAPGQRLVWQRLAALQLKAGRPHEAAQALYSELGLLPDGEDRYERLVVYAELVGKHMGDAATALQALKGLLTQQPTHAGALKLLEDLRATATDPQVAAQLADVLLPSYRSGQKWQQAAVLLAGRVDLISDPAERLATLKELAAIRAEKLNDPVAAYADLERAFREAPGDAEIRYALERLAEAAGAWQKLADAYTAALGVIQDANTAASVRRKLAEVLDKRLGRGQEAIEHYRATTGGQLPDDLASLEAMERLLRQQNRSPELAEVLQAIAVRLPADQGQRKQALHADLAQLCETVLADKGRAVDNYKALIAIDPKDEKALRALDRLLEELSQPKERADALEALVAKGSANTQLVDDLVKLGAVRVALGQPEEAVKHYRAVLLKKREHPAAMEGLEALLTDAPNKAEVAQILEPIYTAKQDHQKLALVLEARLEGTQDATQRKGLLRRIGDIYENRLQKKDIAFAMARRSLHEDPTDMGVRMWIEKLAGETGALGDLAAAYVDEAGRAEAPLALQFHRRAAAILHEKLADTAGAVAEYRAILALEAKDEKALNGLETILRAEKSYADLVELLRNRLGMTAVLERKREYLAEIAGLQAKEMTDPQAAIATYREILVLTPEDVNAFGQIEQLLAQLGMWEDLGKLYEAETTRLAEKRGRDVVLRRLEYLYRRGRILDEQFGEREAAAVVFESVLAENPTHGSTIVYLEQRAQQGLLEAILILEKVYGSQKAWQKYVELLETKLKYTPETERRRTIYLSLASTYDAELRVGDMAFMSLTRAYNENRADLELFAKMEELAQKNNNWVELVELAGVDVGAIADPEVRQHTLRRLGAIAGDKLNDIQRATAFLQQALQYEPGDDQALAGLDALLEKNQLWAALTELLERRIELAAEPGTKSKLLERLASVLAEKMMDAEAALRCHKQILEIDPDHPISLKSMQKLYAEVQDWDSLAKNLQRQSEVLTGKEDQIRIHAAAGQVFTEELNDNSQAIDHWQKVAALDPTHQDASDALEVLLTAEERWEELAEHYRRRLAHTQDPAEKSEINRRLGVILGEKLGRSEDALGSWLEVLNGDAKNLDALRALLGLYSERAMWKEFVDAARRIIPLTDPAEAKEVRLLLAKALGENLGQRDEAIKLAREVRATEPHTADQMTRLAEMLKNIQAFDEAVLALEKAAGLEADVSIKVALYYEAAEIYRDRLNKPNDAKNAYEAIRVAAPADAAAHTALAEVYRNTNEWRKLVALHEEFIDAAEAGARLPILVEIRNVQDEKLGEKELAFIAACRVFKESPADPHAAEALERLGVETNGAEELVAVLEDEVEHIVDTAAKISVFRRAARIYADKISDVASAEASLEKILAIEPGDLEALDALAALGAREERYDKQIAALQRKLSHVAEDTARKAILFEIARIYEDKVSEIDEALGALQRVLEIDGSDQVALDNLARLYERENRWADLSHTLTRKVELATEPAASIPLRLKVASLCEGELKDPEAAIQWYRGVLEIQAGHAGALAALERLFTGLERWSELIQVFEMQLNNAAENEEKIRILAKEASIYEEQFESIKDAAACFERIFKVDATHLPSLKNLERVLRGLSEWHRLIEVLSHHITLAQQPEEITDLYLQIGEIYYRELSQVDKAEQIYNAARDFNPNSAAALHALGQLYERSGNWFQSLEMLQKEAEILGADPAVLPTLLRIGRINEEMLGDMAAARTAYQKAIEIDASYTPALQAMKEIARAAEDWDAYAEHLIAEADSSDDNDEKTELFFEAAKFYSEVREDEESAKRYYGRALEISPAHLDSARAMAEIHFRNEEWAEAGALYEIVVSKIDKNTDPKDYCQKNYRLGYISEKIGKKDEALAFYREAFEADATYLPALEGLGQALIAAGEWEEAQKVVQTILVHHKESLTESEIVDAQWQLGELGLKQNQPDRAYKQFERALEIDPDHAPSLKALAELDEKMENWEGAYERLSVLAEAVAGADRGQVLLKLSEIARTKLADMGRSIEALERSRRMGEPPVVVLEELAQAYLDAHQAPKAVEVLEQAIALSKSDREKLSALCFRLGQIYETEIKHEPLAVQKYNEALDANPTNIKAFEVIERILTTRREWALLEQNYRSMIARAKDLSAQIRLVLWRNLAELYRRVLKNVDAAIMAYEVIQKLDPGKPIDVAVMAELYAEKPEHRKRAIDMLHEVVRSAENPVEALKKLRKLYHADRNFDAVYVLCSALAFLKAADAEEMKIFEYLAQGVPQKATQRLLEEQWPLLLHPDLAGPVGVLSAWLYRSAPDVFTEPAAKRNLKKKDQIDVRTSDLYFANMMRYILKLLSLPQLDLYRKAGSMEALHLEPAQPPALVGGENNEIFRDAAQRVVLFHVGRTSTYGRPELFLPAIYPADVLRDVLLGACVLFNPSLQHNGDPRDVAQWAQALAALQPQVLKRLQGPAKAAYPELVKGRGLELYTAAVELTAMRAGLLASGDLAAAVRGVTDGGLGASNMPVRMRVKELVLFATSREYMQLRLLVGAALVEGQRQPG